MNAKFKIVKEQLSRKQIICFIMATIGLVMIIGFSGANQSHGNFIGIACGLSAAAFYATVILLNKHIRSVTGIDRTLIQLY
jgi:drug/metabolite transporter (DMT)-like permease